jgi:sporulation protein YlmC with PRC-barrel domain
MEKLFISVFALVLSFAPVSPLHGAEKAETFSDKSPQSEAMIGQDSQESLQLEDQYQTAVEFVGLPVVLLTGEEIGKMQSITTDEQSGLIHFFTITQAGDSGEEREISVPYGALRFYNDKAILIVERDIVDSTPKQVELSDAEYQEDLQSHYGISPVWGNGGQEGTTEGSSGEN